MKSNKLELVFILDKSGSMQPVTDDTIGGFNSNIRQHKDDDCEVLVTTVLFDSGHKRIHDRIPISEVPVLTAGEYAPDGTTALFDAVGSTIKHIDYIHKYIRPEDVPAAVLFIIITDGMENASREYTGDQVRKMVEARKEAGWDFVFIGADIDAFAGAASIGIDRRAARQVIRSRKGIDYAMYSMSKVMDFAEKKAYGAGSYASLEDYMDAEVKEEDKS